VGCTFYLDVLHGIRLGEDQVAFHPIYRLRQSLAVAISRLHDPSPGKYLAYKSVVNVFDENGFAILDGEPGPRLDFSEWESLLNDGPRLNRIIQQAKDVAIDTGLPPEIIQANELGFADYIYFSFRLFGDKISSLYYFYYLIVAATCLVYVVQFRKSPFLLFLLVIFLSEIYFLENYANSYGIQLNAVTNSRLFSGLSLVPALHVLFVLWQRQPPRLFTIAGVVVQSLIFAFLLSCRTEAAWQVAMLVAVTGGIGLSLLLPLRGYKLRALINRRSPLWLAVIPLLVTAAYWTVVSMNTDSRYAKELGGHLIWPSVLMGIFKGSPELKDEYVGEGALKPDESAYTAVIRDLEARKDTRSPIVRNLGNGRLTIDFASGWREYDGLARSLAIRIILHHPLAILQGLAAKIRLQFDRYDNSNVHSMSWANLQIPVSLVAMGALICMVAGGFTIDLATLAGATLMIGVILLFASVTPMIEPSALSIGTLFSYLGVVAILVPYAAMLLIRAIAGVKSKAKGVSLGAESLR
jgi:hypothetical protein